jgi:hypothetical protein
MSGTGRGMWFRSSISAGTGRRRFQGEPAVGLFAKVDHRDTLFDLAAELFEPFGKWALDTAFRLTGKTFSRASQRTRGRRVALSARGMRERRSRDQLQRWHGIYASRGVYAVGSTSPLEKHSRQILALISAQRDLTLDEIVSALLFCGALGRASEFLQD